MERNGGDLILIRIDFLPDRSPVRGNAGCARPNQVPRRTGQGGAQAARGAGAGDAVTGRQVADEK